MNIIDNILNYTLSLDQQTFKKYMLGAIAIILLFLLGMTYFIYSKNIALASHVFKVKQLTKKSYLTSNSYKKTQKKKNYLLDLLRQENNFDIKSFFESFYKSQKISPEPNWTKISTPIIGNEQLQEVTLQAVFKGLDMYKITTILQELEQYEMVYIKNIKINKPTGENSITLELTIGSFDQKIK